MANHVENTSENDLATGDGEENTTLTHTQLLCSGENETMSLQLTNLHSRKDDNTHQRDDSNITISTSPEHMKLVDFREKYLRKKQEVSGQNRSFKTKWKQYCIRKCSRGYIARSVLNSFPVFGFLRRYNIRADLVSDLIAGLSVGIVQIPSSMAFAMLASLPPICGLYTAFISAVVYFLFGTSNYVSVGSTATVSLIVGTAVEKHEESFLEIFAQTTNSSSNTTTAGVPYSIESNGKIAAATTITFLSGAFLIILGKLRFGIVTTYMPHAMLAGFLTSAMILVIISQIKVVLGLELIKQQQPFKSFKDIVEVGKSIPYTNVASLVTALICMTVIFLVKVCINQRFQKRLPFPLPVELVVVAVGTLVSHFADLNSEFQLDIVGDIPSGLPAPQLPPLHKSSMVLISDAVTVAVVAYVVSVTIAKSLVKERAESINSNQEMVAVGAASLSAALLSGFAVGVSLSRSVVQKSAGGKTQVASLVGSVVVLLVILLIGPLFYSLPNAVLAAVILVAFRGVVSQVMMARNHWNVSKYDFTMLPVNLCNMSGGILQTMLAVKLTDVIYLTIWAVTFTGVICFGVNIGLLLGFLVSILSVIVRTQRSQFVQLSRIEESNIFVNREAYDLEDDLNPKIQVLYFQGPLYFANADLFTSRLRKLILRPPPYGYTLRRESHFGSLGKNKESECNNPSEASPVVEMTEINSHSSQSHNQDAAASFVILDCSGITFTDRVGLAALRQVIRGLEEEKGVVIYLASVREVIIEVMMKTDVWEELKAQMFVTVPGAKRQAENLLQDI